MTLNRLDGWEFVSIKSEISGLVKSGSYLNCIDDVRLVRNDPALWRKLIKSWHF